MHSNFNRLLLVFGLLCSALPGSTLHAAPEIRVLSEQFFGEGACAADIDGDAVQDIVSGPFWYQGPDFKKARRYAPGGPYPRKGYSQFFFCFSGDFNDDGHADILVVGFPGQDAHWFENPGGELAEPSQSSQEKPWVRRLAHKAVGNESPCFRDLTGDGKPELVFNRGNQEFGYATPAAGSDWVFTRVGDGRGCGHGLGVGDVNGDGRPDLLCRKGWFEQQGDGGSTSWVLRKIDFGGGGADMHCVDIDGDGDDDVITAKSAHAWGLSWFEQTEPGTFREHRILTDKPADSPYGLAVSQLHAIEIADFDADGRMDFVTGKRFWAHNGKDPGAAQPQALLWFKAVEQAVEDDGPGLRFEPHLVHARVGVGTQVSVGSLDTDPRPDIIVGNKLGTFVILNPGAAPAMPEQDTPALAAGGGRFSGHVRNTKPLSVAAEQAAFHLPPGFRIDCVASEPDIQKPMNLAFGEDGRLWLTCSVEYPFPAEPGKGRDAIKVIEETSPGVWRVDTFAEDLNIPIGLLPWEDGVICYSIPDILLLRDTDGDGRVDQRKKLYGPFDTSRDTHGMVNGLTLAPDGWIHACHGFNNQSEVAGADGHRVRLHSGNTFRFRPDGSRIEHYSRGQVNPFGLAYGPNGDLFTADCHSKPLTLILPGSWHKSFARPHDGRGFMPELMQHTHGSTAICGLAWGANTHFPATYHDSFFSGEVSACRINRNRISYRGSTATATEMPDFLTCDDPWFRPVDLAVSPDGSLFVADFYNKIIGHYEVDLKHPGRDRHRGRIWRIRHEQPGIVKPVALDPVIAELMSGSATPARLLEVLKTGEALAKRHAAMAATKSPDEAIIPGLFAALAAHADSDDSYLVYALRVALRTHLQNDEWLATVLAQEHPPERRALLGSLCLSLRSEAAAGYLAKHVGLLEHLPEEEWSDAVKQVARHVRGDAVMKFAAIIQQRFADDPGFQFTALEAMHDGFTQAGTAPPDGIKAWATRLAEMHLRSTSGGSLAWAYRALPGQPGHDDTWQLSTKRSSADGQKETPLWSSFPAGERRTGSFTSESFTLGQTFSFHLAGHDGFPDKAIGKKNRVEILDAGDGAVLQSWSPPRNDTAQLVRWNCAAHAGKQVRVRLVDGDADRAYAWLAVGRFSEARLNPNDTKQWSDRAIALAARYRLRSVRPSLQLLLQNNSLHAPEAAKTLAAFEGSSEWRALATLLSPDASGFDTALQNAVRLHFGGTAQTNLLERAFSRLTLKDQRRLATPLTTDAAGAERLLHLMEQGTASSQLLNQESLLESLSAVLPDAKPRLERLRRELPAANAAQDELITKRLAHMIAAPGRLEPGKVLAGQHCLACHQIAGQGQRLAPNLDGIGRRGAARLAEDILAPQRNVDVAFRITTLHLTGKRLVSGFVKQREGAQVVLADATGAEQKFAAAEIERESQSTLSLMPGHFGELLDEKQFADLMRYLMSLQ